MVITTIIHKVAWESLAFRLRALAFGDRNPGELSLPYLSPVWDTPLLSPLGMLYVFLLNEGWIWETILFSLHLEIQQKLRNTAM